MATQGFEAFSVDLYQQTAEHVPPGNLIVSPACLYTTLGLAYIGATGQTADQMKCSLRLDGSDLNATQDLYRGFMKELQTDQIHLANKVYIKQHLSVTPEYKKSVESDFSAEAQNIDFEKNAEAAKEINEWVSQKTNNQIQNFLDAKNVQPSAMLMLVSALHVNGKWNVPFRREVTEKTDFYLNDKNSVKVDMMNGKRFTHYGVFQDLDASAIILECKESAINFLVILPNSRTGLTSLEKNLNQVQFSDIESNMTQTMVTIQLPRFRFENFMDASQILKNMGMTEAFSAAADFSGITGSAGLVISNVFHKVAIDVNEEGIEASAAGSAQMLLTSSRFMKYFKADHPFWFAVRKGSQTLFTGRYVGPS